MNKPEINLPLPKTNCKVAVDIIQKAFKIEVEKTGVKKIVLGLSGGIDSALTLYIANRALGSQNITALYMPYKLSSSISREHAQLAAKACGVSLIEKDLTPMADAYFADMSSSESNILKLNEKIIQLRKGNVLARLRMTVLYDQSVLFQSLVAGTSNKSEILLGYSTLWGDMASAVNPIGDLYKFQVREMSRHLEIPSEIIDKPPSADLWEGQTDEGELNLSYDLIDRILYHWIDLGWSKERIEKVAKESGIDSEKIKSIFNKVMVSQYKRKMPLIIKVSEKTIDREFRYPRDWGL
ncbi:MAG: NAD+ synthase [Spirochaetia bacterium]|nr:NAD+ synthase [Spirochaetia bacterium]